MTEKPKGPEIRRNEDASLDEVVAHNAGFHLEQMDKGHWWMSIEQDGILVHVNLHSKSKIKANCQVQ